MMTRPLSIGRRPFVRGLAGLVAAAPRLRAAEPARRAPFRVLFGNDTTNILSCPSPFHKRGEPFTEAALRASVAETAGMGIDVHLLQPGLGWVPWWPSEVLPMSQHVAWLKAKGDRPSPFEEYVLGGGDVVRVFIEACRACGEAPFVSIRLNDAHHIYRHGRDDTAARERALAEFQFFADHPECRIGPEAEGDSRMQYMLDWGRPEVRAYKLRLIEELCAKYDFDGLELDFMRHWIFFNLVRTTAEQRRAVQLDVVRQVRGFLDRGGRAGRRRWLCVRVAAHPETYDAAGIDLAAFAAAGVDMVNASSHYFTECGLELAAMRARLPAAVALYAELQFACATSQLLPGGEGKPSIPINRRTTPEQFRTVAHQAYAQGADGVSAFNFQYYRGTFNPTDVYGASAEPPYAVFKDLSNRSWLARQPQLYFAGQGQGQPTRTGRPLQEPASSGRPLALALTLAPPEGGWRRGGRLRIQARQPLGEGRWRATLNGERLEPTADVSEPYANPYPVGLGAPGDYRAWRVPAGLPKAGTNAIEVAPEAGGKVTLTYLDLALI